MAFSPPTPLVTERRSPWRRHMKFVAKRVALVLQQLKVPFLVAIENHAHLPGSRKHLRILDRYFVVDVIGAHGSVPFNHMQLVAVEISSPVKPRLVVEIDDIDD